MSIRFNADEILEIAEQIERNGADFYGKAAELVAATEAKGVLKGLSDWEKQHEQLFASMRKELTEREKEPVVFDPDNEVALYLKEVADGTVFKIKEDAAGLLGREPALSMILTIALGKEKDSIAFYTSMKYLVSARLGADKVEKVIKEELGHVALLAKELAKLKI